MAETKRQVNGRISSENSAAFSIYARALGLDRSGLANLLALRLICSPESVIARLPALEAKATAKITVRLHDEEAHRRLVELAERNGYSSSHLVGALAVSELRDRSLEAWVAGRSDSN